MKSYQTDVLVIGSGIAGLYAALQHSEYARVMLVTKSAWPESNSSQAQGGIAVAIGEGDSAEAHVEDTLRCGCGINDREALNVLMTYSFMVLEDLCRLGVPFDADEAGQLKLGREGFHSFPRIIHAGGDATGAAIVNTLMQRVREEPQISIYEEAFVEQLVVDGNRCVGAILFARGEHILVQSAAVVLAAGGCGQLYKETTNSLFSTGDGMALACEAGADLADMEFVQFHPTALAVPVHPKPLVSEAVRGEGGVLINDDGYAFMPEYHPWGDLAPRDVVARAIFDQQQKGQHVYLDTPRLGPVFGERFPTIYRRCLQLGFDPVKQPLPVTPAAHFIMGGVWTDEWGLTSLDGLYACGEVACTGVHGANRLASNSLLEGLVFAKRIKEALQRDMVRRPANMTARDVVPRFTAQHYAFSFEQLISHQATRRLQQLMWEAAGLVRTESGLRRLEATLRQWEAIWAHHHPVWTNMARVALAITRAALERTESRGAHFRADYPYEQEVWQHKRTRWRRGKDESSLVGGTIETSAQ
ncbi:L-aspartate oxidase [Caldalkalibacillus uzonensis]|uniref:L-aspartate oxidase n=1 Tax=Caldalkalibacillus uzonensis TaxID=353224 RepID=A0ABU0CUP7_9BACI|nr:L-aspartate oxidase [Caldalkalibacillus uzonensis]MDQ0340147.1 L-aspartate oxidase [Caldalkalibacillus uzonensis]